MIPTEPMPIDLVTSPEENHVTSMQVFNNLNFLNYEDLCFIHLCVISNCRYFKQLMLKLKVKVCLFVLLGEWL